LIVFLSYDGSNDLQPVDFTILSSIQLTVNSTRFSLQM
jgi:hypothetical protein